MASAAALGGFARFYCRAGVAAEIPKRASMAKPSNLLKVAVGQMTASADIQSNFQTCAGLVQDREAGLWLSLGGFQEKGPDAGHLYNTHVVLDDAGGVRGVYRKIHLFDVDVPGGPVLKESRSTAPGSDIIAVDSPIGKLGLTVCYDLRFPELYQQLRFQENAQILLVPSAFTKKTGEAHWEILLRARAVETQCYVIAAAQAGKHNEKRESYGDALIIDPWGTVIARCADKEATGIAVAELDHQFLESVRQRMPIGQLNEIIPQEGCEKHESGDEIMVLQRSDIVAQLLIINLHAKIARLADVSIPDIRIERVV
ncbi:hypothetical protein AXG93_3911s1630 [Marchantia polymorpha subsp. ruderalis]|uniref:CN hydrolase domain-containing protein n=1 Tax=Marchantia polymorpha subsp. ruderalis TaxID=1480154 RepID=A0A176W367_MARPO|nr:hypothetical protein AXG93_3911s1630 [Marchantia polymorpha subsp. ruderalis]